MDLAHDLFRDAIGSKATSLDHSLLRNPDGHFHFNLDRCLDGVGLGNNTKFNRIVSAARAFIRSEDVCPNLEKCGIKLADKLYTQWSTPNPV